MTPAEAPTQGWDREPGDDGAYYRRLWSRELECFAEEYQVVEVFTVRGADDEHDRLVCCLGEYRLLDTLVEALWLPLPTPVKLVDDRHMAKLLYGLPSDDDINNIELAVARLHAAEISNAHAVVREELRDELLEALAPRGSLAIGIRAFITKYKTALVELKRAHGFLNALRIGTWTQYKQGDNRPKAKHVFSLAERIRNTLVDIHDGDETYAAETFGLNKLPDVNPRYMEDHDET